MRGSENGEAGMRRALRRMERQQDAALDLDALAAEAGCSRFHFQRRFAASFGLPPYRYHQLLRLKRAAHRLAFRRSLSVIEIALEAGFDTPDGFARAFRQHVGQSPSAFRDAPDWTRWREAFRSLDAARSWPVSFSCAQVEIRTTEPIRVAMLSHRGDPAGIGDTIARFIAWRKRNRLPPASYPTFNVFHDDPHATPPDLFRLDLCVGVDRTVPADGEAIVESEIGGGRHAVLTVHGRGDDLEEPAWFLYRDWLPGSGEVLRDAPLFCRRLRLFPDVAEHEALTELFLPLM